MSPPSLAGWGRRAITCTGLTAGLMRGRSGEIVHAAGRDLGLGWAWDCRHLHLQIQPPSMHKLCIPSLGFRWWGARDAHRPACMMTGRETRC